MHTKTYSVDTTYYIYISTYFMDVSAIEKKKQSDPIFQRKYNGIYTFELI